MTEDYSARYATDLKEQLTTAQAEADALRRKGLEVAEALAGELLKTAALEQRIAELNTDRKMACAILDERWTVDRIASIYERLRQALGDGQ